MRIVLLGSFKEVPIATKRFREPSEEPFHMADEAEHVFHRLCALYSFLKTSK